MFGPAVNLIFALLVTLAVGFWLYRKVRRQDRLIAAAFLLAVALSSFFGFRLVDRALYWANPAHHGMAPEPWMSPGLIEHSWHLPPQSLAPVIGIAPDQARRRSLTEIADMMGEPVDRLIARIRAVLPETPGPQP